MLHEGMSWFLVLTPLLFVISLAKTTPQLPADVLNNLAALQSAENILVHIEDLTNSDPPSSTTTTVVTKKVSTKQILLIDFDSLLESGRRFAGAPLIASRYNDDVKGLEVLYEMKRRLQQANQNNLTPSPIQPSTQFIHQNQFKESYTPMFPYYGLPSDIAAKNPGYLYPPDEQTGGEVQFQTQPQDPRLLGFTHYAQPAAKQSPADQPIPAYQEPRPARPVHRPQPGTPLQASSTIIPEWLLRDIAKLRRDRRPMDSQNIAPRFRAPGQPFSSSPTAESIYVDPQNDLIEPALLETNVKMTKKSRLREGPHTYTAPPPTTLFPQRHRLTVQLTALPIQLSGIPKRFKVLSMTNTNKKLEKLMAFMKDNRDALLQFIAMKRQQLVAVAHGAMQQEHGETPSRQNDNVRNRLLGRYPPVAEALISGNEDADNSLKAGIELRGKELRDVTSTRIKVLAAKASTLRRPGPAPNPINRALPPDYPQHHFDLAPAKGDVIDNLRYKDRICQRNIMQVAGPKYDHKARVRVREYRPGVDGRAFRVTKRKRMLLPACCNCCKKSVLGCQ